MRSVLPSQPSHKGGFAGPVQATDCSAAEATDSVFISAALSLGWETSRCQIRAWNDSVCGVISGSECNRLHLFTAAIHKSLAQLPELVLWFQGNYYFSSSQPSHVPSILSSPQICTT